MSSQNAANSDRPRAANIAGAHRRGFTLVELLVVIAIIGMVAALLFPVFAKARQRAKIATCLSNLRQIGMATRLYETDYEGDVPPIDPYNAMFSPETTDEDGKPRDPLAPYGTTSALYHCPESLVGWQGPPAEEYGSYCTRFDFYFQKIGADIKSHDYTMDAWRLQPEPETVILYCPAEVDFSTNCQIDINVAYESPELFHALRSDGSVQRIRASQVTLRDWNWGPFAGKYEAPTGDAFGPYAQFPNEPWPPKLTPIGKAL